MKVIFLDIDGVLNSEITCQYWYNLTKGNGCGGFFDEEDPATKENVKWGEDLVENLKYIVEKTNAEIVISSTWRNFFSLDKFKEMFATYNWSNAPIIDKTPGSISRVRGKEVLAWLNKNKVDKYVILDDDSDFLSTQQEYLVNTSFAKGLTKEKADEAIKILNNEK